jgi:hypothetical protein
MFIKSAAAHNGRVHSLFVSRRLNRWQLLMASGAAARAGPASRPPAKEPCWPRLSVSFHARRDQLNLRQNHALLKKHFLRNRFFDGQLGNIFKKLEDKNIFAELNKRYVHNVQG